MAHRKTGFGAMNMAEQAHVASERKKRATGFGQLSATELAVMKRKKPARGRKRGRR